MRLFHAFLLLGTLWVTIWRWPLWAPWEVPPIRFCSNRSSSSLRSWALAALAGLFAIDSALRARWVGFLGGWKEDKGRRETAGGLRVGLGWFVQMFSFGWHLAISFLALKSRLSAWCMKQKGWSMPWGCGASRAPSKQPCSGTSWFWSLGKNQRHLTACKIQGRRCFSWPCCTKIL